MEKCSTHFKSGIYTPVIAHSTYYGHKGSLTGAAPHLKGKERFLSKHN